MRFKAAWYALIAIAVVVIVFELFFRYRYVRAGDQLWRIDRVTEQACLVRVGNADCAAAAAGATPRAAPRMTLNPYLASPTPEPNPR
ncbi:MAG TPA: hypothetical protein VIW73_11655 [Candidatus Cybelea sp.]